MSQIEQPTNIKMVLIGDGSAGKTSIAISYGTNEFPLDYTPTIFTNYGIIVKYGQQTIKTELTDTPGQQEYARIRALSYNGADIFLICFSLIDPLSLKHALTKWIQEVRQMKSIFDVIFVGTKLDLYSEESQLIKMKYQMKQRPIIVPLEEIQKKISAMGFQFLACSSITQEGLHDVINRAIQKVLDRRQQINIKTKDDDFNFCQLI